MSMDKTPREVYADIIDLPHHQAENRPHMSLHDRAAQFAPFAALTGFDGMVKEEARLTDAELTLSESEIEILNQKLTLISDVIMDGEHPYITVTYFRPDEQKAGGCYEAVSGYVKKVDPVARKVLLFSSDDVNDRRVTPIEIEIDKISDISGQLVDYIEASDSC